MGSDGNSLIVKNVSVNQNEFVFAGISAHGTITKPNYVHSSTSGNQGQSRWMKESVSF